MSKIVATRYTYRIKDGKRVRTGKSSHATAHDNFGDLKKDLLKKAKGNNGKFVSLTKPVKGKTRKIKHYYQKTATGCTITYYKKPKK